MEFNYGAQITGGFVMETAAKTAPYVSPALKISSQSQRLLFTERPEGPEEQKTEVVNTFVLERMGAIFSVLPAGETEGFHVINDQVHINGKVYYRQSVVSNKTGAMCVYYKKKGSNAADEDYFVVRSDERNNYVLQAQSTRTSPPEYFKGCHNMDLHLDLGSQARIEEVLDELLLPICRDAYPEGINWNVHVAEQLLKAMQ